MIINKDTIADLAWDKMDNMLPCIVQNAHSGKVLMQGRKTFDKLAYIRLPLA